MPHWGTVEQFIDVKGHLVSGYRPMAVLFVSIGRMPFLASALYIIDPLVVLVSTPGFYLHHVGVAVKYPATRFSQH